MSALSTASYIKLLTPETETMRYSSISRGKDAEKTIPKWAIYSLFFITSILIVSIVSVSVPLLASGVLMLFVWTQLTKEDTDFSYEETSKITSEPSAQRRRYLSSVDEDERLAS